jgi:hypothetical protein
MLAVICRLSLGSSFVMPRTCFFHDYLFIDFFRDDTTEYFAYLFHDINPPPSWKEIDFVRTRFVLVGIVISPSVATRLCVSDCGSLSPGTSAFRVLQQRVSLPGSLCFSLNVCTA